MQCKFSKHLTGFRKNHSTQNALLVMIEKWKTILNKKLKVGALFMDLSKAFDTLDHSLLLVKLSVYGFDNNSLSFVRSYLQTEFKDVRLRIISVIGICNYADDNTLFVFGKTFDEVTRKLQNDFLILDEWFFNNSEFCQMSFYDSWNT